MATNTTKLDQELWSRLDKDLLEILLRTEYPGLSSLQQSLALSLPRQRFLTGKKAQDAIRPTLEFLLQEMSSVASQLDLLEWLAVTRRGVRAISEYLRRNGEDTGIPHILRMIYLAAVQYSARDRETDPKVCWTTNTHISNWESIAPSRLAMCARITCLAKMAYEIEGLYRTASRGMHIRQSPYSGLIQVKFDDSRRDAIRQYDARFRRHSKGGEMLSAAAIPDDINDLTSIEEAEILFAATHLAYLDTDTQVDYFEFTKRIFGLDHNDVCYMHTHHGLASLMLFLESMPRSTHEAMRLSPEEFEACVWARSGLWNQPNTDPRLRKQFAIYGLIVAPKRYFEARMASLVSQKLCVPVVEAKKIVYRFMELFEPQSRAAGSFYESSQVHRYMTAIAGHPTVRTQSAVVVDYEHWGRDLIGVLLNCEITGDRDKRQRGKVFENEWAKSRLDRWRQADTIHRECRVLHSVEVRNCITGKRITDIDIVLRFQDWLLLVDAKSRVTSDKILRGEDKDVWDRWRELKRDLAGWERKIKRIFDHLNSCKSCKSNPDLLSLFLGARFAIPILMTARPEWVPKIEPELVLHPGSALAAERDGYTILRICTLNEIIELLEFGGPQPTEGSTAIVHL